MVRQLFGRLCGSSSDRLLRDYNVRARSRLDNVSTVCTRVNLDAAAPEEISKNDNNDAKLSTQPSFWLLTLARYSASQT